MAPATPAEIALTSLNHWIGGKPYDGPVERWGDVFNPATGQSTTRVAFATPAVVDQAVSKALAKVPAERFASALDNVPHPP